MPRVNTRSRRSIFRVDPPGASLTDRLAGHRHRLRTDMPSLAGLAARGLEARTLIDAARKVRVRKRTSRVFQDELQCCSSLQTTTLEFQFKFTVLALAVRAVLLLKCTDDISIVQRPLGQKASELVMQSEIRARQINVYLKIVLRYSTDYRPCCKH